MTNLLKGEHIPQKIHATSLGSGSRTNLPRFSSQGYLVSCCSCPPLTSPTFQPLDNSVSKSLFSMDHYDKYIHSFWNSALGKSLPSHQSEATLWEKFWFCPRWDSIVHLPLPLNAATPESLERTRAAATWGVWKQTEAGGLKETRT